MSDEIRLTLPRDREFYGVAHLVMGGLAIRLNLTVDELDDLEVALDGLLSGGDGGDEITVAVRLDDGAIRATVGPFSGDTLRRELAPQAPDEWSLRRLLETVADSVELGERDGAQWVEVVKTIQATPRAS